VRQSSAIAESLLGRAKGSNVNPPPVRTKRPQKFWEFGASREGAVPGSYRAAGSVHCLAPHFGVAARQRACRRRIRGHRPARNKLLEAAGLRQIDLVLVLRLDRWGRSVADCVHPQCGGKLTDGPVP
jgi:hypothetical protein